MNQESILSDEIPYSVPVADTNQPPAITEMLTTNTAPVGGQFALSVAGIPNYQYVVQASTNLMDWVSVQTNTAPFSYVDSDASQFRQHYYRTFCLNF